MTDLREKINNLYEELVGSKIKPLVIKFDSYSNVYDFDSYRHSNDSDIDVQLSNIIFNNILFYALEDEEIFIEEQQGRLSDLRAAAETAYIELIPKTNRKTDGLLGELMLDCLLKIYYPQTRRLMSRVKYVEEIADRPNKKELKGYDALVFTKEEAASSIWLGQVKTGSWQYCSDSIIEDLNKNILKNYFSSSMLIMAKRQRSKVDSELFSVVDKLNEIALTFRKDKIQKYNAVINFFKEQNIKIVMPSLLLYPMENYSDDKTIFSDIIEKCDNKLSKAILANSEGLEIQTLFLVFPIRNLDGLREELLSVRRSIV